LAAFATLRGCAAFENWNEARLPEVVKVVERGADMSDIPIQSAEGPPIINVGELKAELSRWPDGAAVTFRCPLQGQELRFYRVQSPASDVVQIDLNQYPETPTVIPT
jgi:hypothetical protein